MADIKDIFHGAAAPSASVFGAVNIIVDTTEMVTQANEVMRLASDMEQKFQDIEDLIKKTKNYWIGEAGELHRQRYNEKKDDISVMIRRVYEHPRDLCSIAGLIDSMEKGNVELVSELPANVIS